MKLNITFSQLNKPFIPFKQQQKARQNENLKTNKTDSFELSIGYVNDIHGQTNNMMRILSGLQGDLKVSAGDNDIGDEKNKATHKATATFLNLAQITATALGNHEFDTKQNDFLNTLKTYNGNILTTNLRKEAIKYQQNNDLDSLGRVDLDEYLNKSKIVEIRGEKIGLIGVSPIDMFERATHPDYHNDCSVDNLKDSIIDIQTEIDNLKKQGINKIVLLSHLGFKRDQIVAKNTTGIDAIIGGHTHELIKDIKEGVNLFYSKDNEPIILTEAGRDGRAFGLLKLEFDKNGVIIKAQNNVAETSDFYRNMIHQYIFDEILGKPEKIGYIKKTSTPPQTLIEENPHANFMCDAMRHQLNTDIAIWNNAGPRNYFHEGIINSRDIKDIAPFRDGVSVAKVSEKEIVKWFNNIIETTYKSPGFKPGLVAVSGMNYTVDKKNGKLAGISIINENGIEYRIDIQNPSETKTFSIAMDSFMMSSGADFGILAKKENCINYPESKDYYTCEYIKHLNKPIEINQTGRIKFI